jgi:hypothetical protein
MDVNSLIHQFQEHQYAASELPGGLDGPAIAELLGERIRQSELGENVVEVGAACFCQRQERARGLAHKFGAWLAGQGHRLVPVDCEDQAAGDDRAIAYYRIEKGEWDA